jgi:adenosylcobinamide-phosphate synthase
MNERIIILLGALALDVLLGEPPTALHPVVWMGRYIGWGERHAPRAQPLGIFLYGAELITLGVVIVVGAAVGISVVLDLLPRVLGLQIGTSASGLGTTFSMLPRVLGLLVGAWLLKTTFAARTLTVAAHGVQRALERGDLPEARRLLSWHLVSRDTSTLDEGLVAAAAVESVAENFSDSLVAPLLFFALFGLPGAMAYRFANTADAMLGYRDAQREYLGKFAARLDDVLNLVPARLSALLLLAGAALSGLDARAGWQVMWRDHARTPSPNAGWPMSAMAGVLGVTLEKVGFYRLGDGAAPDAHAIARGLRVAAAAGVLCIVLVSGKLILLQR